MHVLPKVLKWLRQKNPWLSAYESSLAKVEECAEFCETLAREGCRLPNFTSLKTADDSNVVDTLGDERVAVLMPLDDFSAMRNSYRHLRSAAHVIMQAKLVRGLPDTWSDVHKRELEQLDGMHVSDLKGSKGKPFYTIPKALRDNMSLTQVSYMDLNLDAKVFVDKHPYGTGSYRSTLDCIDSRMQYYQPRLFSLDGIFTDTEDVEWCFSRKSVN